jgi:dipeptidase D
MFIKNGSIILIFQLAAIVVFPLVLLSSCSDNDECNEIRCLEPTDVWGYFYELTQTPRPSGTMDKVRALLTDFGHSLNLETIVDGAGNVLIRKPAAPGMEKRKGVILQAHMDMVAQKLPDVAHDFENDPIETDVVGTVVKAKGTTLGADDGIGAALIMAVLASNDLKTGPIEGLFTVDEETTMSGANGIEPGMLRGDIFINLDWETEGSFDIGSAGGLHVTADMAYETENVPAGMEGYQVDLTGLLGGHSGVNIDKNRGNAAILMSRFIQESSRLFGVRLSKLESGSAVNAIPNQATAVVAVPNDQSPAFNEYVKTYETTLVNELGDNAPGVQFTAQSTHVPASVLNAAGQENIIAAILSEPNGVLKMSEDIPGLVQTSSNLGILKIEGNHFSAMNMPRSSVDEELDAVSNQLQQIYWGLGAQSELTDRFPSWQPNPDSPILGAMTQLYEKLFKKNPVIESVHAGLECGAIIATYPHLDAISIGPTLRDVHTTNEEVEIDTVEKIHRLLIFTLETIPEK